MPRTSSSFQGLIKVVYAKGPLQATMLLGLCTLGAFHGRALARFVRRKQGRLVYVRYPPPITAVNPLALHSSVPSATITRVSADEHASTDSAKQSDSSTNHGAVSILRNAELWDTSNGTQGLMTVHLLPWDTAACEQQLQAVLPMLYEAGVLGMDAEWEPESQHTRQQHRVAVLQLATANLCLLLRPAYMTHGLPPSLQQLLQDSAVIKAGIGIQEDVNRLARDTGVLTRGALDVRIALQRHAPRCLVGGASLQALAGRLLGLHMDKSSQRSSWGQRQLSQDQITYAAQDAWLSRQLAFSVYAEACLVRSKPAGSSNGSNGNSSNNNNGSSGNGTSSHDTTSPCELGSAGHGDATGYNQLRIFFAPLLDSLAGQPRHKGKVVPTQPARSNSGEVPCIASRASSSSSQARPQLKRPANLPTRKTVLYENCKIMAPDGHLLCTCGQKKVQWYLDHGLADVVAEDPITICLKFEPKGRGHADDKYYLSDKENQCCVCGSDGEYLRHSIVPHCYRQYFPAHMKSHLSHDIVLMCMQCHQVCGMHDQRRMEELGLLYNAPLALDNKKYKHDPNLSAVRSAGRALTNIKVTLPPDRRHALEEVIKAHFGVSELSPKLLEAASSLDPRKPQAEWSPHAERVVVGMGPEQIQEFVHGWRRHFLQVMAPRFLPPHWSVEARVSNSSASHSTAKHSTAIATADRLNSSPNSRQ